MLLGIIKKLKKIKQDFLNFLKRIYTINIIIKHHSLKKISSNRKCDMSIPPRVAIQFHIFFVDLLPEVFLYLNNISYNFDLFISTDNKEKYDIINDYIKNNKSSFIQNYYVLVTENRGRDIFPFFKQMNPVYSNYDIIGHFHTKKSSTVDFGESWRKYLYDNLIGDKYYNYNLINYLYCNKKVGFVAPPPYYMVIKIFLKSLKNPLSNNNVIKLLNRLNISNKHLTKSTKYPAGNMFFAKVDAIKDLFILNLSEQDFPEEEGQLENTLQHTIEFIWNFILEKNGYQYKECLKRLL